jgi:hypothetical protein
MSRAASRAKSRVRVRLLLAMLGCGGVFNERAGQAQVRESLTGESAAESLEKSIEAEQMDLRYGPVRMSADASLAVNYTDNVFYSQEAKADMMIEPETKLAALWPISELNTLRLSLGLSYEWYMNNRVLNASAPLVNPGSELTFNLFVGDVHIQLLESFSYQESLFFNTVVTGNEPFFNFNDVGTFSRLDNNAGLVATWDLGKALLSAGYISYTSDFEYLNRASEWFTGSAAWVPGDGLQTGVETQAALHNYHQETILNDNWQLRAGPFVDATIRAGIHLRAGGGFDMARYDAAALGDSDFTSYYAYGGISQDTRLFSHSLKAGHEYFLGDNANNLRNTYVRYSIASPIVAHVDLAANASLNVGEEFGGPFDEKFTYFGAGFQAGWQFHKHWRTELGYEFLRKLSDLPLRDFLRDRVTLAAIWSF